jgi:hypothetical protein
VSQIVGSDFAMTDEALPVREGIKLGLNLAAMPLAGPCLAKLAIAEPIDTASLPLIADLWFGR